jgi:hypothetical protein
MHHYIRAFQLRCESQMLDNCLVFFKEHDKTPEGGKNIYFAHFVIRSKNILLRNHKKEQCLYKWKTEYHDNSYLFKARKI